MIILLHSSKTMRSAPDEKEVLRSPQLLSKAQTLSTYLATLSPAQLATTMHISGPLSHKTHDMIAAWSVAADRQTAALDSFVGDIYKGLRAHELSTADRDYADQTLRILSGMYGIIRPYDGICPYRLEMAYTLPDDPFTNLYKYWGDAIAGCLPKTGLTVNLASVEYARTVTPFVDAARVVAPNFLTINPKTGEPTFVVVHGKIARGAFARWLITNRVDTIAAFTQFAELGYSFNKALSTPERPTFVCQTFTGTSMGIARALPH